MKVFQDIFSNDEMMSEQFPHELVYDGVIMKVKSSYKNKDAVGNVDIGCGNEFGRDEEPQDANGEPEPKVIDIEFNFSLMPTLMSKADFKERMVAFVGKVKELVKAKEESRVPAFQKAANEFFKLVISKFDDFTFYTGTSGSDEGGLVLSYWENDTDAGPVFFYFNDALKVVKY